MARFLILRLEGPMQAWGTHTYEDYRPVNRFPTRSGLLGLLGACLGIDRQDREALEQLAQSVTLTVRVDRQVVRPGEEALQPRNALKAVDFHTVLAARKVDGSVNPNPVVSRREYLYDAAFTVAVGEQTAAAYALEQLVEAVRRPVYTPVLGRRSCPLARPLLEGTGVIEATDALAALQQIPPGTGLLYAEGTEHANGRPLAIRDVPLHGVHRQFGTRWVSVHAGQQEG